ncbi:MAG TPA: VOC family protein [Vicinamibacterales bacterium]|nr:VOC family protein [Vicinamibacterales bacterium]
MFRASAFVIASLLSVVLVRAQAPAPAPAPAGGLVVGSGNFFSPIVTDLDKATAFYRDGLGFAVPGAPSDAATNAPLRNMFGLPNAQLRWVIARPAGIQGGVEIVEAKNIASRPVTRNVQDPGAVTLVLAVRDVDTIVSRLTRLGGVVVTTGGAPIDVALGGAASRAALMRTPDGHFLQLVQRPAPPAAAGEPTPDVMEARVRLTVSDIERTLRLYRDQLGLREQSPGSFSGTSAVLQMLGLRSGMYRQAITQVPTSGLFLQFIEFKDVDRRVVQADIQDPGSTRMQLRVKDLDAAIKAVVGAGGRVVSSGGTPALLPAGQGSPIRAAIVQDPDNLFLVLIEAR